MSAARPFTMTSSNFFWPSFFLDSPTQREGFPQCSINFPALTSDISILICKGLEPYRTWVCPCFHDFRITRVQQGIRIKKNSVTIFLIAFSCNTSSIRDATCLIYHCRFGHKVTSHLRGCKKMFTTSITTTLKNPSFSCGNSFLGASVAKNFLRTSTNPQSWYSFAEFLTNRKKQRSKNPTGGDQHMEKTPKITGFKFWCNNIIFFFATLLVEASAMWLILDRAIGPLSWNQNFTSAHVRCPPNKTTASTLIWTPDSPSWFYLCRSSHGQSRHRWWTCSP